jgi:gluconolactonase
MKVNISILIAALVAWMFVVGGVRADDHDDLPKNHSVKPQLYATGFAFAEGPALGPYSSEPNDREPADLFVVNYRELGTIGRITADGSAGIFCDLRELSPLEGHLPRANGLKIAGQGRLIAADSGAGRLLRISADGKAVEVLADRWEGKRFNSINDVALDRHGNIYFSDPGGSSVREPNGSIYRYDINTSKVSRLATGFAFPNGLAVIPNNSSETTGQQFLCLAESQAYRLLIFDLSPDGKLSNKRVLIDFPTETRGEIIGGALKPDGMIFDDAGRLYVAMFDGGVINVVEVPSGKLIRQYTAGGSKVTNCHFHGGYLYHTVADKEAVFRSKLGVKGFNYNAAPETE